jgi:hypothetical protein
MEYGDVARCCFCTTYGDLDMTGPWARARRTLKPGPDGSRCHTGGSIVLGCGHTWGTPPGGTTGDQATASPGRMETHDELKERARREQQPSRPDLGLDQDPATSPRNAGPERPHLDRQVTPPRQGCRKARDRPEREPGPSSPGLDEAREIPGGNCQQRGPNRSDEPRPGGGPVPGPARPSDPPCGRDGRLRRCRAWLERLDRGETVVVDL